ncbi:MAG: nitrilase-related carbon-nitrogen hydrolase [Nitrosomonadales bacterium]
MNELRSSTIMLAFGLVGVLIGWLAWGNGTEAYWLMCLTLLPLSWGLAQSRLSASLLMLGYYLGGARGLPGGAAVFFGSDAPAWLGSACYLAACLFLALPFSLLWSKSGTGWRFVAATCVSVAPPLAFVGWINPLAVAGELYPAMGWIGLAFTLGMMMALAVRSSQWIFTLAFMAGVANAYYVAPAVPAGWAAVDTHFPQLGSGGGIVQVIDAMKRVDWLVRYADSVPANSVRVLPETVIGPIGDSARFLLADTSARLAKRRSRILAGGELDQDDGRYLNAVVVVGAQGSDGRQAVQGIPVPLSMWHPFGKAGAVADVWGHSGLIDVAGKKTGVLICYEQLLTYSVLWMMTEKPDVLVGASNLWWVTDKTIPVIQAQMMMSFGRLFGVGVVRAVNA